MTFLFENKSHIKQALQSGEAPFLVEGDVYYSAVTMTCVNPVYEVNKLNDMPVIPDRGTDRLSFDIKASIKTVRIDNYSQENDCVDLLINKNNIIQRSGEQLNTTTLKGCLTLTLETGEKYSTLLIVRNFHAHLVESIKHLPLHVQMVWYCRASHLEQTVFLRLAKDHKAAGKQFVCNPTEKNLQVYLLCQYSSSHDISNRFIAVLNSFSDHATIDTLLKSTTQLQLIRRLVDDKCKDDLYNIGIAIESVKQDKKHIILAKTFYVEAAKLGHIEAGFKISLIELEDTRIGFGTMLYGFLNAYVGVSSIEKRQEFQTILKCSEMGSKNACHWLARYYAGQFTKIFNPYILNPDNELAGRYYNLLINVDDSMLDENMKREAQQFLHGAWQHNTTRSNTVIQI